MTITINDHETPSNTHKRYDVTFFDDIISTLVTETPHLVDGWISRIEHIHRHRLNNLIVGLDIEWRPNNGYVTNPVATLQLCVGRNCLIFQLIYAPYIPESLVNFLGNTSYTFVGVGVENDAEKLLVDYGIRVGRTAELTSLAVEAFGAKELKNAGLKGLTNWVLGKELVKPKIISRSRWDNAWLTLDQVQYACVDAFLSFEIGRSLICFFWVKGLFPGDGTNASVWYDQWSYAGPLSSIVTNRDMFRAGFNLETKVEELICNGRWTWPSKWNTKYTLLDSINPPNLSDKSDRLEWRDVSGNVKPFGVAIVWDSLRSLCTLIIWIVDLLDVRSKWIFKKRMTQLIGSSLVPIILNIWTPNSRLVKDKSTSAPVWVKVHNVPIVAYSEIGLSLITSQLGSPIMLDAYTSTRYLKESLVVAIPYPNGKGHSLETVEVEYEWQPPRCDSCKIFDHTNGECPKREKVVVPDQRVDDDGFTQVTRKNEKGKLNNKPRQVVGIKLTKPKPNIQYRPVRDLNVKANIINDNMPTATNNNGRDEVPKQSFGPSNKANEHAFNVINDSDSEEVDQEIELEKPIVTEGASTPVDEVPNV
uniref:Werner syndrome-like exonuclease n=1 Tax=Tanacetum cinerariifolium TaxID=118510 RepID=A0A699H644_TANCI|nr:Werner syndrome-like exonuclease [Tanacetum cinerariifolium]